MPRRVNHLKPGEQRGDIYRTSEVQGGWQTTLICTASSAAQESARAWSGKEFKGQVHADQKAAENSAADAFRDDPDVRKTAAELEPSKRNLNDKEFKQRREEQKRLKRTARSQGSNTQCPASTAPQSHAANG